MPNMPLLLTIEATPFLSEGDPFFFGQGSSGTGTSRGKIHGIQVFGKFLLPLLSGGFLPKGFLGLVLCSAENILPSLIFCYVTAGTFARRGLSSTAKTLRSLVRWFEVLSTKSKKRT